MNTATITPHELEQKLDELAHECNHAADKLCWSREAYDTLNDHKREFFAKLVDKQMQTCDTNTAAERCALLTTEWSEYKEQMHIQKNKYMNDKVEFDNKVRLWETCRSILTSKNTERRTGT